MPLSFSSISRVKLLRNSLATNKHNACTKSNYSTLVHTSNVYAWPLQGVLQYTSAACTLCLRGVLYLFTRPTALFRNRTTRKKRDFLHTQNDQRANGNQKTALTLVFINLPKQVARVYTRRDGELERTTARRRSLGCLDGHRPAESKSRETLLIRCGIV